MEEDEREEEEEETQGGEGDVESSLLDPGPGEEDKEDEEEVEETREEELLKEEVSTEEVKEVDQVETEEEKRSGEEVITLIEVRDHSDPLNVNQKPKFSDLAINSPKDTIMLENDDTKVNEKCQAKPPILPLQNLIPEVTKMVQNPI